MDENFAVLNLPDEMLHISLKEGQARVLLCRTTAMARRAAEIHRPSSTALAAMSRLMTATAMLGVMMKEPDASVTVTVAGDGPAGKLTAVAHGPHVKAAMAHPEADLPLKADGHLDVGGLVGHHGRLTVIKDLGLKEPYIGQCALVSGELGEDFAQYFTVSEQQPSLVALGALVHEGYCLSAGGVLVQAMPSAVYHILIQFLGSQTYVGKDVLGLPMLFDAANPKSYILPVISLSIGNIAYYAMWLRRYMVDESNKDYIRLARAKGVPGSKISFRHVFRNAFVPLVQYIPNSILFTLMGSLYVESLYSVPGMGGLLVTAIKRQDNTLVQALVLIYAVISILGLLFGDILMGIVDPRISFAKKEGSR